MAKSCWDIFKGAQSGIVGRHVQWVLGCLLGVLGRELAVSESVFNVTVAVEPCSVALTHHFGMVPTSVHWLGLALYVSSSNIIWSRPRFGL